MSEAKQGMQDMIMQLFTQETLEQVNAKLEDWDKRLIGVSVADKAHDATGVKRVYLALGALVLGLMFVFFGFGMKFLTTLVGFAVPAYQSFKAIESRDAGDDRQWLAYWVVFGFLELIENFVGFILTWVPFYYTLKLLFVIALQVPQFKGAEFVYNHFLRGLLRKYEEEIDTTVGKGLDTARNMAEEIGGQLGGAAGAEGEGGVGEHDRAQAFDREASLDDDAAAAASGGFKKNV